MERPDETRAAPSGDGPGESHHYGHDEGHEVLGADAAPLPVLALRGALGGVLMGLANLVPGISGGTMLLATGVYPGFVGGIAELTTLRFRPRSILLLVAIASAALLSILLFAGLLRSLVVEQRWIMYSLFIGLTLGGVPLVWRLAERLTAGVAAGAIVAFALMLLMQLVREPGAPGDGGAPLLLLSGLAGASAMVLPGVSGGYLLLVLGQYERILGAVDSLKTGLTASGGPDMAILLEAMKVVVPVGIGVVVGIVGVSNLVRWLLDRYEKPTLGALLGLLLGAVVGLWPFQSARPPEPGDVLKGRVVSVANASEFEREDWPVERFTPSAGQVAGSIALVLVGLGVTLLIDRIGSDGDGDEGASRTPGSGRPGGADPAA